ncbi:MAG: Immunoglobulin I-set domain protein [Pedosphaera sp.]|nr:Immunoglobulin I-set domain protein [Pedosphaera sp.]
MLAEAAAAAIKPTSFQLLITNNMKTRRIPSLLLALFLQAAPLLRLGSSTLALPCSSSIAVVCQWAIAAVAVLGSCHAVSGASALITGLIKYNGNTAVGGPTNKVIEASGVVFKYRIGVANTGTDFAQDFWNATPLPPGLTISTAVGGNGFITGTPTGAWSNIVTITAGNMNSSPPSIHTNVTLVILAGVSAPAITAQPASVKVVPSKSAAFSVTATGNPSPAFQWRKDGTNLINKTGTALSISSVGAADVGMYTVVASNSQGSITSAPPASLSLAAIPSISSATTSGNSFKLTFLAEAGIPYTVESSSVVSSNVWQVFTNIPSQTVNTQLTVSDSITGSTTKFYRVRE